jgi:hypothetical protein
VSAAVKAVLAAQRADAKKKVRKGAAQLRVSRDDSDRETSD